ncbi:MAG: HNH endonuclease [candidate division Zixibacteria bacterium]|nr:HNH endonuclease [candidate division Zixibacteria bacterium]
MSFSNLTKSQARLRQRGKCAHCGESLNEMEESAHYLLRESSGGPDKEENCVMLCQNCHSIVHNNASFQSCYVAPMAYFPYANIYGSHQPRQTRAAHTR